MSGYDIERWTKLRVLVVRMFQRLLGNLVPNPDLNPRFNSLLVDTVVTAQSVAGAAAISGGSISGASITLPTVTLSASAASQTLTAAQSGSLVICPTLTANQSVALPTAAAGLNFKFRWSGGGGSFGHTITAGSAILYGGILLGTTSITSPNLTQLVVSTKTNVIRGGTNGVPGDWIDLESDGTNWYVKGAATGSNTFSVS